MGLENRPNTFTESVLKPQEWTSAESLVRVLYEAMSFGSGRTPDWARLRELFAPHARFVRAKARDFNVTDLEGFLTSFRRQLETKRLVSFKESEIGQVCDAFGSVAQVFSAYHAERAYEDGTRETSRGVHSIQLFSRAGRWWIIHVLWGDEETEANPIPPQYLL